MILSTGIAIGSIILSAITYTSASIFGTVVIEDTEEDKKEKILKKAGISSSSSIVSSNNTSNIASNSNKSLSADMLNAISDKSGGSLMVELEIMHKSLNSFKLTQFAYWYMTNYNARKIPATKEEKEFINSISFAAGYGCIYPEEVPKTLDTYDIRKASRYCKNEELLIIPKEIEDHIFTQEFQDAWKAKKAREVTSVNIPLIEQQNNYMPNRLVTFNPVQKTDETLLIPQQPEGMSDYDFIRLNSAFGIEGVPNADHFYYSYTDQKTPLLNVVRNTISGATNQYIVDMGDVLGGTGISLLGSYMLPNGNIDYAFVNARTEINTVRKLLTNPFYLLNGAELEKVSDNMYFGGHIYKYIDFHNTPWLDEVLRKLDERAKMKRILNNVIRILHTIGQGRKGIPRVRFVEFKSVDDFVLISDQYVKSPLHWLDESTGRYMLNSLTIYCKTDKYGNTKYKASYLNTESIELLPCLSQHYLPTPAI